MIGEVLWALWLTFLVLCIISLVSFLVHRLALWVGIKIEEDD